MSCWNVRASRGALSPWDVLQGKCGSSSRRRNFLCDSSLLLPPSSWRNHHGEDMTGPFPPGIVSSWLASLFPFFLHNVTSISPENVAMQIFYPFSVRAWGCGETISFRKWRIGTKFCGKGIFKIVATLQCSGLWAQYANQCLLWRSLGD